MLLLLSLAVLQIEWNRRKLPHTTPPCVTLRRVALMLEKYDYEAYLVGQPYLRLNFGFWDDSFAAASLPCPPRCTGDVVALRRGWSSRVPVVRELTAINLSRLHPLPATYGPKSRPGHTHARKPAHSKRQSYAPV
jgi:hypothetical protein